MTDKVTGKVITKWKKATDEIKTPKLHLIGKILDDTEGLCGPEFIELAEFIVKLDDFIQNPIWKSRY